MSYDTYKKYTAARDAYIKSCTNSKSVFKRAEKGAALISERQDITCDEMRELYKLYTFGSGNAIFDIIGKAYEAGFYRGVRSQKRAQSLKRGGAVNE